MQHLPWAMVPELRQARGPRTVDISGQSAPPAARFRIDLGIGEAADPGFRGQLRDGADESRSEWSVAEARD
jgi:hypothetical protein